MKLVKVMNNMENVISSKRTKRKWFTKRTFIDSVFTNIVLAAFKNKKIFIFEKFLDTNHQKKNNNNIIIADVS